MLSFNIHHTVMTRSVQVFLILCAILSSRCGETSAVSQESAPVHGLYDSDDKVVVLTKSNFNSKLFNKNHAWFIEFYNSWCGFCRRFAPSWKELAADIMNWKDIVSIGAIDCANDDNNDICRNYEIMAYPTLRYFHEDFKEGPEKFGETVQKGMTSIELRQELSHILEKQQLNGRGKNWPNLLSHQYINIDDVWKDCPSNTKFVFLIFDIENSTMGTEVILDLNLIYGVSIQKVSNSSELSKALQISKYPSVLVVDKILKVTTLTPSDTSRISIRKAILDHLQSEKVHIPELCIDGKCENNKEIAVTVKNSLFDNKFMESGDIVYQTDLETGLRYSLNNEISRMKYMTEDAIDSLKQYLNVLIKYFPFTANGKEFVSQLRKRILHAKELSGKQFAVHIDELENKYAPVYSTLPEWYGCKGSSPHFRGFTCSLWTIFHTLTVSAAAQKTTDASEVLRAMHGYVKHFFGCTDCADHFQAMAQKNNLFSVAENDGAIIWLWAAHNEVNHRLAGDITEDPEHAKRQFPVVENCPKCWREMGAWNLTEVLRYIKNVYGAGQISLSGVIPHPSSSPFSKFDITIFILLHVYFAVMLLLVLRMILIKKLYKRRSFKADNLRKV